MRNALLNQVMNPGKHALQVYYWCSETDEVLWDPPPGAVTQRIAGHDPTLERPSSHPFPEAETQRSSESLEVSLAPATAPIADGGVGLSHTGRSDPAAGSAGGFTSLPGMHSARSVGRSAPERPVGEAQQLAARLNEMLRGAAGSMFAGASKLMWLAVETEVRTRDLATLGDAHAAATCSQSFPAPSPTDLVNPGATPQGTDAPSVEHRGHTVVGPSQGDTNIAGTISNSSEGEPLIEPRLFDWTVYEEYTLSQLRSIESELPAAFKEAASLSASIAAAGAQSHAESPVTSALDPAFQAASEAEPSARALVRVSASGASNAADTLMEEGELSEALELDAFPPGVQPSISGAVTSLAVPSARDKVRAGVQPSVGASAADTEVSETPPPPPAEPPSISASTAAPATVFAAGRPARLALPYDVTAPLNPTWLPMPYPPYLPPYGAYPSPFPYPMHYYPGCPHVAEYVLPHVSAGEHGHTPPADDGPTPPPNEAPPPLPEDEGEPPLPSPLSPAGVAVTNPSSWAGALLAHHLLSP